MWTGPMLRAGLALLAGLAGPGAASAAANCGGNLPAAHRLLAQADGLQIAFAPRPAPLPAGREFALDIVLCPAPGQAMPTRLVVDADMPAHRHGMNYRASITALGDGQFRADGLLLHMAGRWRLIFDLPASAGMPARRLTHEVEVR